MGSNHHICSTRKKLLIDYSTAALLPGISEGEHGFLFYNSDHMLALLKSFVCLGFIDYFTLVKSIW